MTETSPHLVRRHAVWVYQKEGVVTVVMMAVYVYQHYPITVRMGEVTFAPSEFEDMGVWLCEQLALPPESHAQNAYELYLNSFGKQALPAPTPQPQAA